MAFSAAPIDPAFSKQLEQRWLIHAPDPALVEQISTQTGLHPLLAKVLVNHGIASTSAAEIFINPELETLPPPLQAFADLPKSIALLKDAITQGDAIIICGDYDADGMTSTALLLRALRGMGAVIDYAIPSRMDEGYGLNTRIVEDCAQSGVKLILTVDNGIAAYEPVARARELGVDVIITDHHDLPPQLPPANAILNPKLLEEHSPYKGLAGVGVAYVLAVCLAQQVGEVKQVTPLLELFTLGTIADLAPLVGVNRRWVKRGLQRLPQSQYAGIQALIQISGSESDQDSFKPDAIGFRLGPRINAVGRIADPRTVIELLTTDDWTVALARAEECERTNRNRQDLCAQIEQDAIALIESSSDTPGLNPQRDRILVLVQVGWHHGVIGIVASRLVERYGVPVFIGTYENESQTEIRGSARGTPEFNIFEALQHCCDSLEKFGGHQAAGGFTLKSVSFPNMLKTLIEFAHACLDPTLLKPLITIDAEAHFSDLNWDLFSQIDQLHPCGIGNSEPVFWSPSVTVVEQRVIGKQRNHLKLTVEQRDTHAKEFQFKAMAWRWGDYAPLPSTIDIAYRLRDNYWNGERSLELELVGYRPSAIKDFTGSETSLPEISISNRPARPNRSASKTPHASARGLLPQERPSSSPDHFEDADQPLAPLEDLTWWCPEPPLPEGDKQPSREWLVWDQESLQDVLSDLSGPVLLYGYEYPTLEAHILETLDVELEYDRPSQICRTLLLWTIPPSWSHLKWLLALGQPQKIYVHHDDPPLLDADELRSRLQVHLATQAHQPLNLMALGQAWWVAPSTLVAALRELGYPCQGFPTTVGLNQEFQRLRNWYQYPAHLIGNLG